MFKNFLKKNTLIFIAKSYILLYTINILKLKLKIPKKILLLSIPESKSKNLSRRRLLFNRLQNDNVVF